ncbi:unnamed product [Ostreococcus tauri]|uniref:Unnamed product n=1 Tax=Ostreococcus tauri TaxID=70448 RepID=Q013S8_OSTTA|nr:unnamed product [Ostreococcus tauri]CAL54851.1 unnamed product [Ostreococcus tauri]|eukprot:XP_003080683.1 unnamed product [Ostreococcus tauri]
MPSIARRVCSHDGALISYTAQRSADAPSSSNPPTVFVNGLSNDCFQLKACASERAKRVWTIEFDYRGHGESDDPKDLSTVTASSFAHDAWAVVDDFFDTLGHVATRTAVDVVAYSYGVRVAMEMIRLRPTRVRLVVAVLGSPERILDGLLGRRGALVVGRAAGAVGTQTVTRIIFFALRFAATFPYVTWSLLRVLGYLNSSYGAFKHFFVHLRRLHAETWTRVVMDAYDSGAMDLWRKKNRAWRIGCVCGDRDFAAPQRVMRSWEQDVDYYWMLKGVGHDGLCSHGDEILTLIRECFDRADE